MTVLPSFVTRSDRPVGLANLEVRIGEGPLEVGWTAGASDAGEIGAGIAAGFADAMTGQALALPFKDGFAPGSVAGGRAGSDSAGRGGSRVRSGHRVEVSHDGEGLVVCVITWRHGGAGNSLAEGCW